MDLQSTPFTIQLGHGANICLANAVINIGDVGATIQFGSLNFPAVVAVTLEVPTRGTFVRSHARRPQVTETLTSHVRQPVQQLTAVKEFSQHRTSVFKRLSQSEAPVMKRIVKGQTVSLIPCGTAIVPTEPLVPGKHDHEASSSGSKLTRR